MHIWFWRMGPSMESLRIAKEGVWAIIAWLSLAFVIWFGSGRSMASGNPESLERIEPTGSGITITYPGLCCQLHACVGILYFLAYEMIPK